MAKSRCRLGVVGHPISHSLSPVMHNAALRELGLDYEYESFDVEKDALKSFIQGCRKDFLGLNVTIPHKVGVISCLDELSEGAQLIGAVNTVKFGPGKAVGYNTDGTGCVKSLEEEGVAVKGSRILVLGSGGAARAVAFQCAVEGVQVSLSSRTLRHAQDLSADLHVKLGTDAPVIDYDQKDISSALKETDILINTTPVGMFPHSGDSPIPASIIPKGVVVLDIIYNPLETKLLSGAKARGCKTINGVGMLAAQGAESLKIWLGVAPPVNTMKEALVNELKKT